MRKPAKDHLRGARGGKKDENLQDCVDGIQILRVQEDLDLATADAPYQRGRTAIAIAEQDRRPDFNVAAETGRSTGLL